MTIINFLTSFANIHEELAKTVYPHGACITCRQCGHSQSATKDLFWEANECVIQYHPPQNIYINAHPYTLHLWKPQGIDLPMPFLEMI